MSELSVRRPWYALQSRLLLVLLLLGWTAVIWWVLIGDGLRPPGWIPWRRWLVNLGHAPLFGLEAVLIGLTLRPGEIGRHRKTLVLSAVIAVLYGGCVEYWQGMVGRQPSVGDLVTDSVGAFGVPWALSTGTVWGPRTWWVVLVAGVSAACTTFLF